MADGTSAAHQSSGGSNLRLRPRGLVNAIPDGDVNSSRFHRARWTALSGTVLTAGCSRGILDPVGPVGDAEKTILINSTAIMLAIIVPTIIATVGVAFWFR